MELEPASFTLDFQPYGIRLVCEKPLTLLDAARQVGVPLRADCGGEGVCGKCRVQILSAHKSLAPSEAEEAHISKENLEKGFHLACETVISEDASIFIPAASVIENQILQLEGCDFTADPDPVITQQMLTLEKAVLDDLAPDLERIRRAAGNINLFANLPSLRTLPGILRENDWQLNLIMRGDELFHVSHERQDPLVGLAVDVGSTKLACYLVDLASGKILAAKGTPNPQIAYGEDIMARLGYAMKGRREATTLHEIVIASINQVVEEMCSKIGASASTVADGCLVGNTAMHHFFLDLPTGSLAVSPFVPVTSDTLEPEAGSIGIRALPGARMFAPPVIAGFVGSDHLAFLLSAGFGEDDRLRLGIDIGTNTEIALQKGARIVSVSTASGPAFEGAHIKYGMRAAPGAIEHIKLASDGSARVQVIGEREPVGICGSGILDAVAEMRAAGILNHRSRMKKSAPGVKLDSQGMPFINLTDGKTPITLSQLDVDQILLAKGAIRAGIDVLMDYLKVQPEEIEEIMIAGAFGSYMLPEHAMRIGMLPEVSLSHVHALGNAAGTGARMMLVSRKAREQAVRLAKRVEYLELTVYPDFPMFFARGIQV